MRRRMWFGVVAVAAVVAVIVLISQVQREGSDTGRDPLTPALTTESEPVGEGAERLRQCEQESPGDDVAITLCMERSQP